MKDVAFKKYFHDFLNNLKFSFSPLSSSSSFSKDLASGTYFMYNGKVNKIS